MVIPLLNVTGGMANQNVVGSLSLLPIFKAGLHSMVMLSVAVSSIVVEGRPPNGIETDAFPAIFSPFFPWSVTLVTETSSPQRLMDR